MQTSLAMVAASMEERFNRSAGCSFRMMRGGQSEKRRALYIPSPSLLLNGIKWMQWLQVLYLAFSPNSPVRRPACATTFSVHGSAKKYGGETRKKKRQKRAHRMLIHCYKGELPLYLAWHHTHDEFLGHLADDHHVAQHLPRDGLRDHPLADVIHLQIGRVAWGLQTASSKIPALQNTT
jgi:hypothetical protein